MFCCYHSIILLFSADIWNILALLDKFSSNSQLLLFLSSCHLYYTFKTYLKYVDPYLASVYDIFYKFNLAGEITTLILGWPLFPGDSKEFSVISGCAVCHF